jgi:hypothetical protein
MQTGYFASARVDVTPDTGQAGAAPLRVTVIEGTQQVRPASRSIPTPACA